MEIDQALLSKECPMTRAARIARSVALGIGIVPHAFLILALINFVYFTMVEGPARPGDPNIGAAILWGALLLNIPSAIAWLTFLAISCGRRDTAS